MTDISSSSSSAAAPTDPAAALSTLIQRSIAKVAEGVVRVGSRRLATSGTVWSEDGLILTTHSGTRRASHLAIRDHEGEVHEVEVVGRDPGTDLALLRSEARLPPVPRASPQDLPQTGSLSVALARPGWQVRASLRAIGLVGPGFRGPRGGRIDAWIETDRALPTGFAGGPLIDVHGNMIGLDSRGLVRRADLAIPLSTIERVVAELLAHGEIRRGWLGVSLVPVELPARGARPAQRAVLVSGLEPEGPADQAGLLIGDVITTFAGTSVEGPHALREALNGRIEGPYDLGLVRGGHSQTLEVRPGHRSAAN